MKAIEVEGTVDAQGNLSLDEPIAIAPTGRVRVIILYAEATPDAETDPDDTPIETVKESLRRSLQEANAGQRIPIAQVWEGIDT